MRSVTVRWRRLLTSLLAVALISAPVSPVLALGTSGQWAALNGPPGGAFSSVVLSPVYSFDKSMFVSTTSSGVFRSSDGGATFSRLNSGLGDLHVNQIAVSSSLMTDGVIFAATDTGVYTTSDSGIAWSSSSSGLPSGVITGVAVSATYATDLIAYVSTASEGVYRTSNGGSTWTRLGFSGMTNMKTTGLAVSPANAGEIFSWTDDTVFRSTTSASSWGEHATGIASTAKITDLVLSTAYGSDGTAFVGTAAHGVYKTENSGGAWTNVALDTNGAIRGLGLSPNFGVDNTIFATTATGGIFRSTDSGGTWVAVNTGLTGTDFGELAFSNDYRADKTLFAGSAIATLYKSTDGGAGWSSVGSGIASANIAGLDFSDSYATDSTMVAATQGGVFKSTDGGSTWTKINGDLPSTSIQQFALAPGYPTDPSALITIKNTGVYRTFSNGDWWDEQNSGLNDILKANTRTLAISPAYSVDFTAFVGGASGAFRSVDGGSTWVEINTGNTFTDVSAFGISDTFSTDGTLFAGTAGGGMFKSTDRGSSWSGASVGITNGTVNSVVLSPFFHNDGTVFAATNGGIFRSTDGGATWSGTGLTKVVNSLAISPVFSADQIIFAATTGPGGAVYVSSDRGVSWKQLGTNLESGLPVTLMVSPNYSNDQNVFVGTSDNGLWVYKGSP